MSSNAIHKLTVILVNSTRVSKQPEPKFVRTEILAETIIVKMNDVSLQIGIIMGWSHFSFIKILAKAESTEKDQSK